MFRSTSDARATSRASCGRASSPSWRASTYDAVWAPDGSRIAFVSAEKAGDDVYVIDPDGKQWWNYTLNTWEWDKHPSFSPDSRKIVFWSNREGTKQIYVIDADGRGLQEDLRDDVG